MLNNVSTEHCSCILSEKSYNYDSRRVSHARYAKLTPLCYALLYARTSSWHLGNCMISVDSTIPQTLVELGADPNLYGNRAPLGVVSAWFVPSNILSDIACSLSSNSLIKFLVSYLFFGLFLLIIVQLAKGAVMSKDTPFSLLHSAISNDYYVGILKVTFYFGDKY